jgi:hypothetical protein
MTQNNSGLDSFTIATKWQQMRFTPLPLSLNVESTTRRLANREGAFESDPSVVRSNGRKRVGRRLSAELSIFWKLQRRRSVRRHHSRGDQRPVM